MALSKVDYNSLNVTAAASKALKWNSSADGFETGDVAGAMVLLATETASSSATIDFTSDIDSTYKEYVFKFIDIHPQTDEAEFSFQVDTGTNTSYNIACTSTSFFAYHTEGDTVHGPAYTTAQDQAQGTAFQNLLPGQGSDNDQNGAGTLHIFNPSSTTFVKHFVATLNQAHADDMTAAWFFAGYFNTTTALTRVQFKFSTGNIDSGTIKLYGVT